MASTNFIQYNPSENNQESDSQYTADALRINGAAQGALLPSPFFNKLEYQNSSFISAFAQMMVNKGYTIDDSPWSTLVSVLMNVKTNADFEGSIINVPFASSVTFNAQTSTGFYLLLTGNVVSSILSNTSAGQVLNFAVQQDATGGRVFPWPSQITTSNICPIPNSISVQTFWVLLGGATVIPLTPMLWISPNGTVIPQPFGTVLQINASGNISNQYGALTEEVNCTSGSLNRYLPTAIGFPGLTINVKRIDSTQNSLTVTPVVGGQTIDGFPNFGVNPFWNIAFQSDGSNWIII